MSHVASAEKMAHAKKRGPGMVTLADVGRRVFVEGKGKVKLCLFFLSSPFSFQYGLGRRLGGGFANPVRMVCIHVLNLWASMAAWLPSFWKANQNVVLNIAVELALVLVC